MTMLCSACVLVVCQWQSHEPLRCLLTLGTCFCGGSNPSCSALAASARRFSRRWRFSFCGHHHEYAGQEKVSPRAIMLAKPAQFH